MKKTVFIFILVGAAVLAAFAGGYAYAEEKAEQQVVIKEGQPNDSREKTK